LFIALRIYMIVTVAQKKGVSKLKLVKLLFEIFNPTKAPK